MDRRDTVSKVQQTAATLAEKVRDAKLDERAAGIAGTAREKVRDAELEARAAELAALARERVRGSRIDELAHDLLARVRDTAVAQQAGEKAAEVQTTVRGATERTLDRAGGWIGEGAVGEALGLKRRRRVRPSAWVVAGAVAAGVAAGLVLFGRRSEPVEDDWTTIDDEGLALQRSTADGVALPLEGRVREAIGADPRTSATPPLNINVVDGTVFVRGSVSPAVDQDVLRSIIEGVEGVTDVDLQVTVSS